MLQMLQMLVRPGSYVVRYEAHRNKWDQRIKKVTLILSSWKFALYDEEINFNTIEIYVSVVVIQQSINSLSSWGPSQGNCRCSSHNPLKINTFCTLFNHIQNIILTVTIIFINTFSSSSSTQIFTSQPHF